MAHEVDLQQLWVELNRPSPEKFRTSLQRRGIEAPSVREIKELFYKYQASKQLFAHPPKYKGKIFSPGLDRRWAADIIVNSQRPSVYDGKAYGYALVVQDIFSRYAWAELIDSPMQATGGMEAILHRAGKVPDELTTDADPGFKSKPFQELLNDKGIHHTLRVGRNDIATVDRLIATLKQALAVHSLESGKNDWAERLQAAVKGYNETSHPRLMQGAPEDLRRPDGSIGSKLIYFDREVQEAHNLEQNTREIKERAGRLDGQGFRVFKHKEALGRRIGDPRWGREIHSSEHVDGAFVEDEHGEWHPTKEVLSVPKSSTVLPEAAHVLNDATKKARGILARYAARGEAFLSAREDRRASSSEFYRELEAIGNPKEAVRLAKLDTKAVVASFVRAFPDVFNLVTSNKGGHSFVELKAHI